MLNADWEQSQKQKLLEQFPIELIEDLASKNQTPFQIIRKNMLVEAYQTLQRELPMVEHHFAIKAFPSLEGIRSLADIGAFFDIASNGELELIAPLNISGERLIHTHPIKRPDDVRVALERGVTHFVYDSLDELETLEAFKGQVRLSLRISFRSAEAQIDLSSKFGCSYDKALEILKETFDRGFVVDGLSFHAGSQLPTPQPIVNAITQCRTLFDKAQEAGVKLSILDIGGGYPGNYTEPVPTLPEFCAPIRQALEQHFPDTKIYSEPGRGVVANAVTSVARVMGSANRDGETWYYLDDGVYGSYSGQLFEHGKYHIWSLKELREPSLPKTPCTVAGPTCDSVDVMERDLPMPDLKHGDIVVSPSMGAYSWATATEFNNFPKPQLVFID